MKPWLGVWKTSWVVPLKVSQLLQIPNCSDLSASASIAKEWKTVKEPFCILQRRRLRPIETITARTLEEEPFVIIISDFQSPRMKSMTFGSSL